MKEPISATEIGESDVRSAVESLNSASFKKRFIRTDRNAATPEWKAPSRQPINEHVRHQMDGFKVEVNNFRLRDFHGGVFQRFDSGTMLTVADLRPYPPVVPTARDLFHVYGPDRDNSKNWYHYRYAWKDYAPQGNAIIYSNDTQIIQEGKLACNAFSYSDQSSYALVGAGMFFFPRYGNANVSIRPYVQWLTTASFTGNDSAPASAVANLGIYVESWPQAGGAHNVDHDDWIPVWSQNTQSFMKDATAGGAATVGDGLTADIFAVTDRKYAIFVYVYLQTSAGPQEKTNELRFVTIDMEATVPFVVVEEKLV